MTIKTIGEWYNYRTGEYEIYKRPETDDEAKCYISQDPSAQALYGIYREMGLAILESIANTLAAQVGEPGPFPVGD